MAIKQKHFFSLTLLSMRANLYFLAMAFKGLKLELLLLVEEFAKKYHKNVQPSNLLFSLFFKIKFNKLFNAHYNVKKLIQVGLKNA